MINFHPSLRELGTRHVASDQDQLWAVGFFRGRDVRQVTTTSVDQTDVALVPRGSVNQGFGYPDELQRCLSTRLQPFDSVK
ncbi:hypothetical protein CA983_06105 [Streptomyces swartbergensis]|uniref:Uncharacterized protein n=1 Tax=Streptomyces swartbergensis TaxID=487165 RepID=A0A243S9P8_9ACTN|nr:hypothetical protein CA983_06105 [Streptomyces swartbergensis]